jgi:hypothetical protein
MGFNKRLVSEETIENSLKNKQPLSDLFKADAIIFMDDTASKAYTLHTKGHSDDEIKLYLNEQLKGNI